MRFCLLFILSFCSIGLFAQEDKKQGMSKISEAFGHLIGKNMEMIGIDLDIELVLKGLRDAASGKEAPMTEAECIEAITCAQEKAFKQKAQENLSSAENFLKDNAKHKDIVVVEEGKLQYKIDQKGAGQKVEASSHPVIRYVGKYLDGSIFGQSKEGEPITLTETIQGFQKGLLGMREGEKRTLYIHPVYGYGTQGYLPPNSLLTFEIELVKANDPKDDAADALILESENETKHSADLDARALR